jgi:putative peptide zinc metalloprotease protein
VPAPTSLPKLRDDLVIARLVERGEPLYVYKVAETQDYYRLDETQHAILLLLRGNRTPEEVVAAFNAQSRTLSIDLEFLGEFVEGMRALDIFEKSPEEKKRLFLEKVRDQRRATARAGGLFGNVLDIKLSAWNPDRFFEWLCPRIRFFWTPGFVAISAACMLVMLGIWASEWTRLMAGTIEMFTFRGKTAADLAEFFVILLVIGFFHESAHGLTCKHFGGQVPRMGFMLISFTPCFFVDITDAYMFDRHAKRQWVIFAGGYIELFFCALATFVWALTDPGSAVNDWCYKFMLLTGISSVIINYNPLIKLDGYYAIEDYLEISELWERSFDYVSGWIKKTIFRLPVELESATRKVRAMLVGYCLASVSYKILIFAVILTFLKNTFLELFGDFGYPALAIVVYLMFRKYAMNLGRFLKFALADKKEILMRPRLVAAAGGSVALLLAGLLFIPIPVTIGGRFTLEARSAAVVRPAVGGTVAEILAREGRAVGAGEPVAVLRNPSLSGGLLVLQGRLRFHDQEAAEAAERGDRALLARKRRERALVQEEIALLRQETAALTLRSPVAGVVTTPRLEDLLGSYLQPGQTFCTVADAGALVARVPVRERLLDEVLPGQSVDLKAIAHPFDTLRGRVVSIAPVSVPEKPGNPYAEPGEPLPGQAFTDFDVIIEIEQAVSGLREGMAGQARIHAGRSTPARRIARAVHRWYSSRIW